jgi:ASPIC and UnbV/FG-GAP-like repeat
MNSKFGGRRAIAAIVVALLAVAVWLAFAETGHPNPADAPTEPIPAIPYRPREDISTDGFGYLSAKVWPWAKTAGLEEIRGRWLETAPRLLRALDAGIADPDSAPAARVRLMIDKSCVLNAEGRPLEAYRLLERTRAIVEDNPSIAGRWLYSVVFYQGVAALRHGETENCVLCRGESSCILPIAKAAIHANPDGSRWAIRHFDEYLDRFPDDDQVRWLLNVAHMTLGQYPHGIDPARRVSLDRFANSEFDIGRFRDVGHLVGVNRFNRAGGAVLEDFDGDGLLDLALTDWFATEPMAFYRNTGNGTFEDRSKSAGLEGQYGGLNLVQADHDNDGRPDLFVVRGAWLDNPIRPSLLRNLGDGKFADVTEAAGVTEPMNSNCAAWADYDNDGFLDLFVCGETRRNFLYRNKGDGTFEEVGREAGLAPTKRMCKGAAWIDFDNNGDSDLYLNNLQDRPQFFRNNGNGTFTDATEPVGIDGPEGGFSCWAFDYDNDGWLDLFATRYDFELKDVIRGVTGRKAAESYNRLYRNVEGKRFENVTGEAGLDTAFATMGSNYADFDNDGFLDFYLGTGAPDLAALVPNRMFKNVGGTRFAEITGSSGTGHLQKGHGVACGDWNRDGHVDIVIETGGTVAGDRYHTVLFQNPGQGNGSVTVKLRGTKSNRSAIGARIKAVTSGPEPRTIHRHVSSGSSFGANPLEQTIGLGKAESIATLEIHWPTSGTTQVFRGIPAGRIVEIEEFAKEYKATPRKPIPLPKG